MRAVVRAEDVKRNEDAANLLKRVTAAALRAIAGRADVGITYGGNEADVRGNRVRMPNPAARSGAAGCGAPARHRRRVGARSCAITTTRCIAGACRSASRRAPSSTAWNRSACRRLGARRLSGVAANLEAMVDHTCRVKGYAKVEGRDEALPRRRARPDRARAADRHTPAGSGGAARRSLAAAGAPNAAGRTSGGCRKAWATRRRSPKPRADDPCARADR